MRTYMVFVVALTLAGFIGAGAIGYQAGKRDGYQSGHRKGYDEALKEASTEVTFKNANTIFTSKDGSSIAICREHFVDWKSFGASK